MYLNSLLIQTFQKVKVFKNKVNIYIFSLILKFIFFLQLYENFISDFEHR